MTYTWCVLIMQAERFQCCSKDYVTITICFDVDIVPMLVTGSHFKLVFVTYFSLDRSIIEYYKILSLTKCCEYPHTHLCMDTCLHYMLGKYLGME